MIAFSTSVVPQTAQLTIPAASSLSKSPLEANQLSKLCPELQLRVYLIMLLQVCLSPGGSIRRIRTSVFFTGI
jgi:hypothetical protein